jgi:tryptophan halogenase
MSKIESVVIVGGGSSGWMTAAALSKLCPHLEIALIESPNIKTVGVGESTLGHINKFLHLLDLKDEDWMPACNATYKNSIRFTNFRENDGTHFEYPFGPNFDLTDKPHGLNTWSEISIIDPSYTPDTFAGFYNSNTFLATYNKQTRNENGVLRNYNFQYDTAYHLDAELFGKYLKENIAIPNGVKHIYGDVTAFNARSASDRKFEYIIVDDEYAISADLYIDCTGFKSLLLGEYQGVPFETFEKKLANDSAWACRLPYIDREKEMHNVTDCHALGNGWVWNIPLWNRIGTGYVYSSRFTTKEEAQQEFREHLAKSDPKRAEEAEMFHIDIKHGKRTRAWVNNVVGVGLSYGFVEPLESTGLLTTHENIIKLVELLNRRDGYVCRAEIDTFNFAVDKEVSEFADFVSMHYAFSMREDTPYWRWATQINEYNPDMMCQFVNKNSSYQNFLAGSLRNNEWHPSFNGVIYIAAGMGMKSISYKNLLDEILKQNDQNIDILYDTKRKFEQYRDHIVEYIQTLPSHYEYLRDNIYGGIDEHLQTEELD